MSMALKIALPRIIGYIEEGSSGTLSGSSGSIFEEFYRSLSENVSFVVMDETFAKNQKANETMEERIMDLFMRNEADVIGVLLQYRTTSKYLSPSCPLIDLPGAALHSPHLAVTNQNVLDTLNIFSFGIITGIFLSVSLLAILLKLTKKLHYIDSTSSLAKCLINQANFNAAFMKTKAIIMLWLICSFIIMEIYEQAINADMVSFDYSHFVESPLDVDRNKSYVPLFALGDPILDHFKYSPDPIKKRIWNRKNKVVDVSHYLAWSRKFDEKEVYMSSWDNLIGTGEYLCGRDKNMKLRKRPKYFIATNGFDSAIVGFQFRTNLHEKVRRQIWHRSLTIGGAGFATHFAQKCNKPIREMSPDSSPACLCYAKEDLYDDEEKLRPIRSENISSLIAVFCLLWVFSVTVFLAELMSNRLRVLRHQNSNTIAPFLRSDSLQSHLSEIVSPSHGQCINLSSTDPTLKPGALLDKQTEKSEDVSGKNLDEQLEVVSVNEESDE